MDNQKDLEQYAVIIGSDLYTGLWQRKGDNAGARKSAAVKHLEKYRGELKGCHISPTGLAAMPGVKAFTYEAIPTKLFNAVLKVSTNKASTEEHAAVIKFFEEYSTEDDLPSVPAGSEATS